MQLPITQLFFVLGTWQLAFLCSLRTICFSWSILEAVSIFRFCQRLHLLLSVGNLLTSQFKLFFYHYFSKYQKIEHFSKYIIIWSMDCLEAIVYIEKEFLVLNIIDLDWQSNDKIINYAYPFL